MNVPRLLVRSTLRQTRLIPRRSMVRCYSEGSTTPLPKAERNPAHKSTLPLAHPNPPPPIAHSTLPASDFEGEAIVASSGSRPVVVQEPVISPPLPVLPPPVETAKPIKRPVGAVRGSIIGFLLGITLTGGYGYFNLWEDYRSASSLLLGSVEELKTSTQAITTHIKRIERVEKELEELKKDAATKKDIEALRSEYKKLIEAGHLDFLDLKAHVWGVEQDVSVLMKVKEVRIV